jgi:hypothetical protein
MFLIAVFRLEPPPNTDAPSVNELEEAMAGSLKCLVKNIR